ncbi:hypothetical protein P7E02_23955 [Enterococcus hulanensis]|uniref:DUF6877 family protein n=1 Tax=Enterococcus hulanensis TaxID=2559929 RepID=UPI002890175E|nr:DUF6877 family protein [Enterococcus hulanensis]MDT2662936.1 hypothetical protein [Enterococcus hulanensis]
MSPIDEINLLVAKYNFPLEVLQDVNHRLECCKDDFYVKQQLRYLNNLVNAGLVSEK